MGRLKTRKRDDPPGHLYVDEKFIGINDRAIQTGRIKTNSKN